MNLAKPRRVRRHLLPLPLPPPRYLLPPRCPSLHLYRQPTPQRRTEQTANSRAPPRARRAARPVPPAVSCLA